MTSSVTTKAPWDAPSVRPVFDVQECPRCGGTGRYSFNGQHDLCYQCGGHGKALTSAGKAAKAAWLELRDERWGRPVEQVQANCHVWLADRVHAAKRWCRVLEADGRTLTTRHVVYTFMPDTLVQVYPGPRLFDALVQEFVQGREGVTAGAVA